MSLRTTESYPHFPVGSTSRLAEISEVVNLGAFALGAADRVSQDPDSPLARAGRRQGRCRVSFTST
jgi:hypothetical protein